MLIGYKLSWVCVIISKILLKGLITLLNFWPMKFKNEIATNYSIKKWGKKMVGSQWWFKAIRDQLKFEVLVYFSLLPFWLNTLIDVSMYHRDV